MKKFITLLFALLTTGSVAQIEIKHGLLLGGGQGFVSGAGTNLNSDFWSGKATVSEIFTEYRYNALLGYKLRIKPTNGKTFYDIDASICLKNINYSIHPERIIPMEEDQVPIGIFNGGKRNFFTSLSLTYNYRTYKELYVGAGIAPLYCDDSDASNRKRRTSRRQVRIRFPVHRHLLFAQIRHSQFDERPAPDVRSHQRLATPIIHSLLKHNRYEIH
jgi:hypothetical protein